MAKKWISSSYGKINLGYSLLQNANVDVLDVEAGFIFIEWADRIEIIPSNSHHLTMDAPLTAPTSENIIVQAVNLLEREVGLKDKFNIHIKKQVPVNAGFGIAASNAATVMMMINKIANLGLSQNELMELGKQLRFDVTLFINGKNGIVNTKNNEFEPLNLQDDFYIITGYPDIALQKEEILPYIYQIDEPEYSLENVLKDDPEEWVYFLRNELEPTIFQMHELIGNMKDQFYEFGATYAAMNGSGSSVYGLFNQEFVAIHAYDSFYSLGFKANITRPDFEPDQGVYILE